jgi:hypothetical protein
LNSLKLFFKCLILKCIVQRTFATLLGTQGAAAQGRDPEGGGVRVSSITSFQISSQQFNKLLDQPTKK